MDFCSSVTFEPGELSMSKWWWKGGRREKFERRESLSNAKWWDPWGTIDALECGAAVVGRMRRNGSAHACGLFPTIHQKALCARVRWPHWPKHSCIAHASSKNHHPWLYLHAHSEWWQLRHILFKDAKFSVLFIMLFALKYLPLKMDVKGNGGNENEYTLRQWKLVLQTTMAWASERLLQPHTKSICATLFWAEYKQHVVFTLSWPLFPLFSVGSEELFWSVIIDKKFLNKYYEAYKKKKKKVLNLRYRNKGKMLC